MRNSTEMGVPGYGNVLSLPPHLSSYDDGGSRGSHHAVHRKRGNPTGPMSTEDTPCPACGAPIDIASGQCPACGGETMTLSADDAAQASIPDRIGEFSIVRLLGRGGMAAVYEAYEEPMRRVVALKILEAGFAPSQSAVARFEREAWIGGRLSHPNIVRVFSQGAQGATHYIAMELVGGGSL